VSRRVRPQFVVYLLIVLGSGTPASASPHVDLQQVWNLISPFAFRSEVLFVSRSSRGGYTLGFCGWHESRNELRVGDLAPAPCVMPGCRAPISSKGKQQIGAVFCGIRSIETQTAVCNHHGGRGLRRICGKRSDHPGATTCTHSHNHHRQREQIRINRVQIGGFSDRHRPDRIVPFWREPESVLV
jgi:hypothetical protein